MAVELLGMREACSTLSVRDGDEAKDVEVGIGLSVEYVEVIGPAGRDGLCSIYGNICIWDANPAPVTLFSRSRDKAEAINLANPNFRFLTLTDDHSSRPLWGGNPIFVKIELKEKLDSENDKDDPVIAQVEYKHYGYRKTGRRCFFEFEPDSDFCINMAYASIFCGVSVRVEFTINKDIAGDEEQKEDSTTTGNKRKRPLQPTLIYGTIGATQSLQDDMPAIKLYYATNHHPRRVDIGSPVDLDRKLVVAPTSGGVLGIGYTLYNAANDKLITQNAIPFCVKRDDDGVHIRVPKDLTYTQTADDGIVTASITFVPFTYPQVEHN